MKDYNNCECSHYVTAHPTGSSHSGWGCLYTGGHCLPDSDCDRKEKQYQQDLQEEKAIVFVN